MRDILLGTGAVIAVMFVLVVSGALFVNYLLEDC